MAKRIIIFDQKVRDKFIDAYKAKNEFNYLYTLKDLQRIFKLTEWTLRKISKSYRLSRNKQKKLFIGELGNERKY